MDYQQYYDQTVKVAKLVDEQKDYPGALEVLRTLLDSDIADLDKAVACMNAAVVCEKMGQPEEALAWFDRGMAYEHPHSRFDAAERKAAFLAQNGRDAEALALYEDLLEWPSLTELNKHAFGHNVKVLRDRVAGNPVS